MITKLEAMLLEAKEKIQATATEHDLYELKAYYTGKKSPLGEIMKQMGSLTPEERKTLGAKANETKQAIEKLIFDQRKTLEDQKINAKLESEKIDVTMPGKYNARGTKHPLTQTIEEVEDFFIGMGYNIAEGPEVEYDIYNFEMLNIPKDHPARDMQDSLYITNNVLMRTQTSPVQIRTMLHANGEPIKILCPGKVYRRDDDDATHSHQFMQFEGLVIDKNIKMSDLKGTLSAFVKQMFGDSLEIRFRPSYFPFTEPSVEVDVSCFRCHGAGCPLCKHSGWIEILGAGMVHPNVLAGAGYDPKVYRGFAFGIGIERVSMLRNQIDTIRHFYTNDVRFLKQFEREE